MTDSVQERLNGPVPRPRDELASEELDGETVIYDERSGFLHMLDEVATVVWRCLDGEGTLAALVGELAEVFDTDPEQVARDVVALVERLEADGLLDSTFNG